jgi:ADP-heptose:LPS heptosyltransferase
MQQQRVLIIRLSAMGDVAMTSPIVERACLENPDVVFDVLSTSSFAPFFEPQPNLNFVGTDIRKEKHGLTALWRLFKELRASGGYNIVLDLHDVIRSRVLSLLFRLCGAKIYRLDKGRSEKRRLVSGKERRQLREMVLRYEDVFRAAGLKLADGRYRRPKEPVPSVVTFGDREKEKWVGVSPFAQHKGKMYPLDSMREVVDRLASAGCRVFVFGGGSKEREQAQQLVGDSGKVHNMIGVMPLADEMALMSNLDCMVSMDSSAMHLCSLYGVRVVSVWGATHRFAGFLGYGQAESDVVERGDLDCRPCSIFGNKPCALGDYRCMDISPDAIFDRVMKH